MYEAESIPKNGTAPAAMGGFKFVQVGDAARVIRKALAEKNVSMIPTSIEVVGESEHPTSSGKMMTTLTVRTTWTLTDGESGETAVIQSMGSGADMGDKAAPKAQSNAMKYALLMGFLLSTGDEPEQSDTSDRRAPQRPVGNYDQPPDRPQLERRAEGLVGTVEVGKSRDSDFEIRQAPDGWTLGFKLKGNGGGFKVITHDELALQLIDAKDEVVGKLVTVHGTVSTVEPPEGARWRAYQVIDAERVKTPAGMLPVMPTATEGFVRIAPDTDDPIPIAEGQESLFDQAESDRIDREAAEE